MTSEQRKRIINEILDWRRENSGASYYDMKAYAYNNDRHEWLKLLDDKEARSVVALCFRDMRRSSGKRYIHTYAESYLLLTEAEESYRERNTIDPCMKSYVIEDENTSLREK